MGKRMTIKDIARLAGVSVGAVSTAFSKKSSNVHLSEATREKIFQVARENHYIPNIAARSMQTRKSYLLGFFYRMDNAYLQTKILRGIREICMKHEYDIIVYPCESLEDERYYLETLHVNQLDGIITIPILENGKTNEVLYRRLADRGIPVIQILADLWKDMAMIGRAFFSNEILCNITTTRRLHIPPSDTQPDDIIEYNQMELIDGGKYEYEYLVGCKTGYTNDARSTLVSCAEKDGMKLNGVVMRD